MSRSYCCCGWRPRSTAASPRRPDLGPRLLYVRAAARHAELLATDLRQHGDALADLLMCRARKAQPQARAGVALVGRPFRPRIDRDAGGECGLVEFERIDLV